MGDGTPGNGANGQFEFIITENDIPYSFGYLVIVAEAAKRFFYDIVEIDKPILSGMYLRGRIKSLSRLNETSSFNSINIR